MKNERSNCARRHQSSGDDERFDKKNCMNTDETVRIICERYCGRKIRADEELIKSKLISSFSLFEMLCEIETEFHIEFLPEEMMETRNFSTVENMINIIKNKVGRK